MARDVNIKVKLSTEEAQRKLRGLEKESADAAKKAKAREEKAEKKAAKKVKAKKKAPKDSAAASVLKQVAAVTAIVAALDAAFNTFKAVTISAQKNNDQRINAIGNKAAGLADDVDKFTLQFAKFQGLLDALSAQRRLARVGLSATSTAELQKSFDRRRRLEAETTRRERALGQSDYLELLRKTMGWGGD